MRQGDGSDILHAGDPRRSEIGIVYVEASDSRQEVLTALNLLNMQGRKQIVLALSEPRKIFREPIDFDGLKQARRDFRAQLVVIAPSGSETAELARARKFPVYSSLEGFKQSLLDVATPDQAHAQSSAPKWPRILAFGSRKSSEVTASQSKTQSGQGVKGGRESLPGDGRDAGSEGRSATGVPLTPVQQGSPLSPLPPAQPSAGSAMPRTGGGQRPAVPPTPRLPEAPGAPPATPMLRDAVSNQPGGAAPSMPNQPGGASQPMQKQAGGQPIQYAADPTISAPSGQASAPNQRQPNASKRGLPPGPTVPDVNAPTRRPGGPGVRPPTPDANAPTNAETGPGARPAETMPDSGISPTPVKKPRKSVTGQTAAPDIIIFPGSTGHEKKAAAQGVPNGEEPTQPKGAISEDKKGGHKGRPYDRRGVGSEAGQSGPGVPKGGLPPGSPRVEPVPAPGSGAGTGKTVPGANAPVALPNLGQPNVFGNPLSGSTPDPRQPDVPDATAPVQRTGGPGVRPQGARPGVDAGGDNRTTRKIIALDSGSTTVGAGISELPTRPVSSQNPNVPGAPNPNQPGTPDLNVPVHGPGARPPAPGAKSPFQRLGKSAGGPGAPRPGGGRHAIQPLPAPLTVRKRRQAMRRALLVGILVALTMFLIGGVLFAARGNNLGPILPFSPVTATVTLTPTSVLEQNNYIITGLPNGSTDLTKRQVMARTLSVTSNTQTANGNATGSIQATTANGSLTLQNTTSSGITLGSTTLRGKDGVLVKFNGPVFVSAASSTSVTAYAVNPGSSGNIPAFDVTGSCCAPGVFVNNKAGFSGGQDAIPNSVIQQSDIDGAANPLVQALMASTKAALQKDVRGNERVVDGSANCTPSVTPNHQPGDQAKQVQVSVNVSCKQEVFDAQAAQQMAIGLLQGQAASDPKINAQYALDGQITATILNASVTGADGRVNLEVQAQGLWVYQFTPTMLQNIKTKIVKISLKAALDILQTLPGVSKARIDISSGTTMPGDPNNINLVVHAQSVTSTPTGPAGGGTATPTGPGTGVPGGSNAPGLGVPGRAEKTGGAGARVALG